jgi:hypothetical protein
MLALERASSYLIELLPAFTGSARQLLFEHSPGRGNPKFTGDYTAFDAMVRYSDGQGRNGFVAFEIKYSESMREPMPELKPRHAELSAASGLFTDPAAAALRTNPLLLSRPTVQQGLERNRLGGAHSRAGSPCGALTGGGREHAAHPVSLP